MARGRYYGSYIDALPVDQTPLGFTNQKVSPIAFLDVSVSYDLLAQTQLTLGVQNLWGTYPDRTNSALHFLGYKYQYSSPYDENGGLWYARLTQRF